MNLILLTVDCLRADHLSCLGYSKKTSPNLDKLASDGVLFSQAISVSHWTSPSFISIFTSTYPLMHGGKLTVASERTTLTQVLKRHGYHTAAFHSNPWLLSRWGYHEGFDTFDSSIPLRHPLLRHEPLPDKPRKLIKRITGTESRQYRLLRQIYTLFKTPKANYINGVDLNRKAITWLKDKPGDFFLWLHYMDVHEPYIPYEKVVLPFRKHRALKLNKKADLCRAPRYLNLHERTNSELTSLSPQGLMEIIALYDARVSYVDKMINSLLATLKQCNILENTCVIITADHGQQFLEHGLYGHQYDLYEELIRVPLIIIGKGLESRVISQQVSLLDLSPTILAILGIEKPRAFLGNSLLPLINENKINIGNSIIISEADTIGARNLDFKTGGLDTNQKLMSLRTAKWKYIYNESGQDELYCLEDDPKEAYNVIAANPELAADFKSRIMSQIKFEGKSAPDTVEHIKARISNLKRVNKI